MSGDVPAIESLSVDAALARMLAAVTSVGDHETVDVRAAMDRVLAHALVSPLDVPAHDNAAMDGYAIRGEDLDATGGGVFSVVGQVQAGSPWAGTLAAGQALALTTGSVMPAGADTVVMQEHVLRDGARLQVPAGQQRGQHRRRRGEDLALGAVALAEGRRLTPADVGLIASLGLSQVVVTRRLRVAVMSTGDEIAAPGQARAAGQVFDSNRYTLAAMLARLGVEVEDLGVVRDDPQCLVQALSAAAGRCDALISSGGVSAGIADHMSTAAGALGRVSSWHLAMRPGRPFAFGRIDHAVYFGLPGNPVAVMVAFGFLVRDVLLRMMGARAQAVPRWRVPIAHDCRKTPGRTEYQRAIVAAGPDGAPVVHITGHQGSGVLRSMSEANCMLVLEQDRGAVRAGEPVDVVAFAGLY